MLKVWFCVPPGPHSDLGLHQMAEDRVRSIVDESLGASAEGWLRTG